MGTIIARLIKPFPISVKYLKKEEDATGKQSTDEVPVRNESETSEEVREENKQTKDEKPSGESTGETKQEEEKVNEEEPVLELVNEEEEKSLQEKIKDIPNKLKEEPKIGSGFFALDFFPGEAESDFPPCLVG